MSTDTSTNDSATQQYSFQAEIGRLLNLLSESLYQNREITVRELVSNASDALDKRRFAALTDNSISAEDLRITIEPRPDEKLLVIADNGIGMTREELVENLGTIAHSGSLEFLRKMQASEEGEADLSLIGQFGVGFYSAFMLAGRVEVVTRSVHEDSGWIWESSGDGTFSVAVATEKVDPGTSIRLHLKAGREEFSNEDRLKHILRKYSTFVPHPVDLNGKHINDQPPIWVEPKSSLTDEQYADFYEYLTHFPGQKPNWHLHLSADSPFQFHSILFCPESNLERTGFGRCEHGLHLCAKRILVQNDNTDLLPDYLRFLRGIVDSADLPLNVSREALQDHTVFRKMRKVITKKVFDHLESFAEEDEETWIGFYREFGSILREGMGEDFENRGRIAKLLRFESTKSDAEHGLVSLSGYCERAPDGQKQIYFLTAADRSVAFRDPNLEIFQQRGLEVLLLTDPVDEYMLTSLGTFNDRKLMSVDSADLELPASEKPSAEEGTDSGRGSEDGNEDPAGFNQVLKLFQEALGKIVTDVRRSERLTESTVCLVNAQGSMSTTMQKVLQINTPDFVLAKMILEVNPRAPLIVRLSEIVTNTDNSEFVRHCGRQLYDNAMVLSGLAPDGNELADRTQSFMLDLAQNRSSIIRPTL